MRQLMSLWGASLLVWSALAAGSARAESLGPEPTPLWPEGAPGAMGKEEADTPTIRVYLPPKEKATGAGVVICPGGGYGILAMDHEGHQVAKWFNRIGVAGFVLRYRHAPKYRHPTPLRDTQRALRFVRANSEKFGVSQDRLGVMGFSAGGHLASTSATHFDLGKADAADPIDRESCRPDFAILCYPVISMTEPWGHGGSKKNLLGDNLDPALAENLSNEKQVNAETPPTFLFHTGEDTGVPVANSLAFYSACVKAKVPAELHVYQIGPHGVGLAPADPATNGWKDRLADWMKANGFLADVKRAAAKGKINFNGKPLRWGMITLTPKGSSNQPNAWAMVNNGSFSIPAYRGAVMGENQVVIHNLGGVEPRSTIEDSVAWDRGIVVTVASGENEFAFDLKD